jgi:hypothetical protein
MVTDTDLSTATKHSQHDSKTFCTAAVEQYSNVTNRLRNCITDEHTFRNVIEMLWDTFGFPQNLASLHSGGHKILECPRNESLLAVFDVLEGRTFRNLAISLLRTESVRSDTRDGRTFAEW